MRAFLFAAGVTALAALSPARAADPTEREVWAAAFKKQSQGELKVFIGEDKDPKGNKVKLGSMGRVWAELCDKRTREPLGKYVSLSEYKWSADEPFMFHFETSVPVYVYMFNVTDFGDPPQVLPSDKYPLSKKIYAPGTKHTAPFRMRTADTDKEEKIEIFFVPTTDLPKPDDNKLKVYRADLIKRDLDLKPKVFIGEDGPKRPADKPEDVCDYIGVPPKTGADGKPEAQGFRLLVTIKK